LSKRNAKHFIKKINNSDFYYTISNDPKDFRRFYNNMYLPYVRKRYYNVLLKLEYSLLKHNFSNGELLLIKEGNHVVAGGIINYSIMKGQPRGTQLGVSEGNFDLVKKGALIAYYYYAIQHLTKNGFKNFNIGPARPFWEDGVLKHKLLWSAQLSYKNSNAYAFCINSKNKYMLAFLANNPFLCVHNRSLCLAIFKNAPENKSKFSKLSDQKLQRLGIRNRLFYSI